MFVEASSSLSLNFKIFYLEISDKFNSNIFSYTFIVLIHYNYNINKT